MPTPYLDLRAAAARSFAALVVVGNVALRLPVKMPGHSGVVWMALLVIARASSCPARRRHRRPAQRAAGGVHSGSATRAALDTFLSYLAAGAGVVFALVAARRRRSARAPRVAGLRRAISPSWA